MGDFVKVDRFEDLGQVMALFETDDEGRPSIKIHISGEALGLGVCSLGIAWNDDDEGWQKAEGFFENIDREKLYHYGREVYYHIEPYAPDQSAIPEQSD